MCIMALLRNHMRKQPFGLPVRSDEYWRRVYEVRFIVLVFWNNIIPTRYWDFLVLLVLGFLNYLVRSFAAPAIEEE